MSLIYVTPSYLTCASSRLALERYEPARAKLHGAEGHISASGDRDGCRSHHEVGERHHGVGVGGCEAKD